MSPTFAYEKGYTGRIAGVDEVGRGCLAGPVIAAAVILDPALPVAILSLINDSKKISKQKREKVFHLLTKSDGVIWATGSASVEEVDQINVYQAALLAMKRAIDSLPEAPNTVLVDGNAAPQLACSVETIIQGDQKSYSIAAASIIAKVIRDQLMQELHQEYPFYGWQDNAGYGVKKHKEALEMHGVTRHHRKTYAPIAALLRRKKIFKRP